MMDLGALLSPNTPNLFVITLYAAAAVTIVLGSSVSVYMAAKVTGVSSSSRTTGDSADNPGWIPVYVSIIPSRSYSVNHSKFFLVRFCNSKLAPYSVFLEFYPHLLTVFITHYGIG